METMNDVLSQGNLSDILEFMKNVNLNDTKSFNFSDILWLLKDKSFYSEVIKILRSRKMFNENVWSFSILHGSKREFYEFVENSPSSFASINSFQYLTLGDISLVDTFNVLDYSPLINPRVHNIGKHDHNILNKQFKDSYCNFLKYCMEKGNLQPTERLYLACYLILQDRIKEALQLFKDMKDADYVESNLMTIQYEYLKAYLSLYNEYPTFETARELSAKYSDYHLKHWKDLFRQIDVQLKEFDTGEAIEDANEEIEDSTTKKLKTQSDLNNEINKIKAKIDGENLVVLSFKPCDLRVKFFYTDLEFLVSKDPFLSSEMKNFIYVQPNSSTLINSDKFEKYEPAIGEVKYGGYRTSFLLPDEIKSKNLLIEVSSPINLVRGDSEDLDSEMKPQVAGTFKSQLITYFPISFDLKINAKRGTIRIFKEKRPLAKAYIKSFMKTRSGEIKFWKDGYTDLRGAFNFTNLGGSAAGQSDDADEFSLFVMSPEGESIVEIVKFIGMN